MILTAFEFENYKAFPGRERIDIKPLTILIGKNSAGKSAVARLPVLLAHGMASDLDSPLELNAGGVDFGSSLVDLIHDKSPHGSVGLSVELDLDGKQHRFSWNLQHFDEYRMFTVSEFATGISGDLHKWHWRGGDPIKHAGTYRIGQEDVTLKFTGLLPNVKPSIIDSRKLSKGLTYLGPFREKPQRFYRFPSGHAHDVGHAGANAPALLGSDVLRRKGEVLSAVGEWFQTYLGGWALDLVKHGDSFSLVLRNPKNASVEVNIADTGTGIAQVLPIVVQRQFEALTGAGMGLEIVEQPELHLHPAAHGDLADLYIEAVKRTNTRFIVETHSENFLLRTQLRVAEGKLDPNKVAIYWVDNGTIQSIKLNERGDLSSWPEGVFSEDFEEVRRIRNAQKGKR